MNKFINSMRVLACSVMKKILALIAISYLFIGFAAAQESSRVGSAGMTSPGKHVPVDPASLPQAPEINGTIPWSLLVQVDFTTKKDDKKNTTALIPKFSPSIEALDGKEVSLVGFMLPLDADIRKIKNFLLTKSPVTCAFCMPGGPESVAMVESKKPIPFDFDYHVFSGRLQLLRADPSGLLYKLVDVKLIK